MMMRYRNGKRLRLRKFVSGELQLPQWVGAGERVGLVLVWFSLVKFAGRIGGGGMCVMEKMQ